MGPGTIAAAEGGEYAGGALLSTGGGRLVAGAALKGLVDAMCLVVEFIEGTCFWEPNDDVLRDADLTLAFGSLLDPNFLKNEGILFDVE